jgi:hypothetical protein
MRSFGSGMCLRNSGIYVTWRESNMVNKEKWLQFLSRVCCYLGCFYPVVFKVVYYVLITTSGGFKTPLALTRWLWVHYQ